MSTATTVRVLGAGCVPEHTRDLVRRRPGLRRIAQFVGKPAPVVDVEREVYWPITVVHASAEGTFFGRPWTDRVLGAVDLVTGRIGLVDVELPDGSLTEVARADTIPGRLSRQAALDAWHAYFRDYIDRRRKPMRAPALKVDAFDRVWLPNHVVACNGHRYLVDPLVGQVDDLKDLPYLAHLLADTPSSSDLAT